MPNTKMDLCLMLLITIAAMTCAKPSRPGDKIHFQDSDELKELDLDQRLGQQQRERNQRGRTVIQTRPNNLPQFEQGIPDLYPIKGPPQAPLVLSSNNYLDTTNNLVFATQPKVNNVSQQTPKINNAAQQPPKNYHYAGNPFLSKFNSNNNLNATDNQLPSPSNCLTTTTTATPKSCLTNDSSSAQDSTDESVTFADRGLFDSVPICKSNEIIVRGKCRPKV